MSFSLKTLAYRSGYTSTHPASLVISTKCTGTVPGCQYVGEGSLSSARSLCLDYEFQGGTAYDLRRTCSTSEARGETSCWTWCLESTIIINHIFQVLVANFGQKQKTATTPSNRNSLVARLHIHSLFFQTTSSKA